jgi:hypothetical protein
VIADTSLCPSSSLVKNTFRYLSKYYRADIGGTRSLVTTRGIRPPFFNKVKNKGIQGGQSLMYCPPIYMNIKYKEK